jgi:N-acetylneuraminic acid mutarotase
MDDHCLSECERYSVAENLWDELPTLPVSCCDMSAVVLNNSLYGFGGMAHSLFDTVQKLSLSSLTWEYMQLKLPHEASQFPCFKTDTEVYLVIKETLFSFAPLQIKPIKSLPKLIECYYSRGTLYYDEFLAIRPWL